MKILVKYDCWCEDFFDIANFEDLEELYEELSDWLAHNNACEFMESLDEFDEAFKMLDVDWENFKEFSPEADKHFQKMMKEYNQFMKCLDEELDEDE